MWQHMHSRSWHLHEGLGLAQAVGLLQQAALPRVHLATQQVLHELDALLQLRHVGLRKHSQGSRRLPWPLLSLDQAGEGDLR